VKKGNKPDFHLAMGADKSKAFYQAFLDKLKKQYQADRIKGMRHNSCDADMTSYFVSAFACVKVGSPSVRIGKS
jgi:D-Tyr-tRNAtyr deacylase